MIVREYEKDEVTVHKVPLMLMGGIVLISLALTASVQLGFFERSAVPEVARAEKGIQPVATRTLRFFDEPDGTVRVEDGNRTMVLGRFATGEGGFIRATVRSLVHQRRIREIGAEVPFELTEWDDGGMTLRDPATGFRVEVSSFGPDNRAVYAAMLPKKEAR
jgi:putative photosynthetic complex assembly protein